MNAYLLSEISPNDYASVPDYILKSVNDFDGIAGYYSQSDIFDLLAMMYRAEHGNEENVIQRLITFSDMPVEQQVVERRALKKEYAHGRSAVEELHLAHMAVRGAPLEYRPASTTDAESVLQNAPWLSKFHGSVTATHGPSTIRKLDTVLAAHILRAISQKPGDTEIKPPKTTKLLDLLNEIDREIVTAGKISAQADASRLPTLPLFMMNRLEGKPVIVSDDTCKHMEETRNRPERIRKLWAQKQAGLGYAIESHDPDYSAWVVPAGDGYGNIILATGGEPIANEDDLNDMDNDPKQIGLQGVRERYVTPEFRGKGLGTSLIMTREKTPLLSRVVTGSGFFSPGGYASRIKAHRDLTEAYLDQKCVIQKPDVSPEGTPTAPSRPTASHITAKGQTPNPS